MSKETKKPSETAATTTSRPRRSRFRSLLRWLGIGLYVLGLLVLLEIGARVTWYLIERSWGLVLPQDISRFDPIYGWSLVPGAHAVSKATGRPVHYDINAKGLRGPEVAYEKPEYMYRILFLGDSHTFGFGVPLNQQFPTLIGGYFPGVDVVNMRKANRKLAYPERGQKAFGEWLAAVGL